MIDNYFRAQAIEDGVLVDVTEGANRVGFKIPAAVTSEVWHGYVSLHHARPRFLEMMRGISEHCL